MKGFRGIVIVMGALALLAGCRGQPSEEAPVVPIRNMYQQPRYGAQQRGEFFEDGRTMRHRVPGTVAREMEPDLVEATGRKADGSGWVLEIPDDVTPEGPDAKEQFVERGQERYGIYCAPCHGLSGKGDGLVARRATELGAAAMSPPTFHDDRLRQMPDGQLYATITNGIRNMPAYNQSIPQHDRWAIVAYVRALQVSQASQATASLTPKDQQPESSQAAEESL